MDEEKTYNIGTKWVGQDSLPTLAANQFIVSDNSQLGETVLFVGHLAPPVILGEKEEQIAQFEALDYVPIRALGLFALSDIAVKALRDQLTEYISKKEGLEEQTQ